MTPEQRSIIESLLDSGASVNAVQKELSRAGVGMNRQRLQESVRAIRGTTKDVRKLPGGAKGGRKRKAAAPKPRTEYVTCQLYSVGTLEGDFSQVAAVADALNAQFLFMDQEEAMDSLENWMDILRPDDFDLGEFSGSGGFDGNVTSYFAASENDATESVARVLAFSGNNLAWIRTIRRGAVDWRVEVAAGALAVAGVLLALSNPGGGGRALKVGDTQLVIDQALEILAE